MASERAARRSAIERVARAGRAQGLTTITRTIDAGETVFRQDDPASAMYLVQSGRIELRRESLNGSRVLAVVERGDFFGEMGVLEALPRSATATALEPAVLLELSAGALMLRIRRDPSLAVEMLQRLSARIRRLHDEFDALGHLDDATAARAGTDPLLEG